MSEQFKNSILKVIQSEMSSYVKKYVSGEAPDNFSLDLVIEKISQKICTSPDSMAIFNDFVTKFYASHDVPRDNSEKSAIEFAGLLLAVNNVYTYAGQVVDRGMVWTSFCEEMFDLRMLFDYFSMKSGSLPIIEHAVPVKEPWEFFRTLEDHTIHLENDHRLETIVTSNDYSGFVLTSSNGEDYNLLQ